MVRKIKILLFAVVMGCSLYTSIQIGFWVDSGMSDAKKEETVKTKKDVVSNQAIAEAPVETLQPAKDEKVQTVNLVPIPETPEPVKKPKKDASMKRKTKNKTSISKVPSFSSPSPSHKKDRKPKRPRKKKGRENKSAEKRKMGSLPEQTETVAGYSAGDINQIRNLIWKTMKRHCRHSVKENADLKNAAVLRASGKGSNAMQILTKYGGRGWKQKRWKEVCGEAWVERDKDSRETAEELVRQMALGTNEYAVQSGLGFFAEEDGVMTHIRAVLILTD